VKQEKKKGAAKPKTIKERIEEIVILEGEVAEKEGRANPAGSKGHLI
jgi:hypothetical protein